MNSKYFKIEKMKKQILKLFTVLTLGTGMSSCGSDFLETDYYTGIDIDSGLSSVNNIATALNGTYYQLFRQYFAGNYAVTIGDVPTDLAYWNSKTGHWDDIYTFTYTDTDTYLYYIWDYGYKVADNAARIIQASKALYDNASESDKANLDLYMAEAYALRGYAQLVLTNVYAHQIKVNGTDHSDKLGIVVIDEPIQALTEVSRSTVGESYQAIIADFNNALTCFNKAGGDRSSLVYLGVAATQGLLARTYLYMEKWSDAKTQAQAALATAGITTLNYGDSYAGLYYNSTSNEESFFALAINESKNWSANSCGTLWTTYNFSPSPKLLSLYGENDCRTTIFGWAATSTEAAPVFNGGKFTHKESMNPAYATNYIVNAPEMYLIIAEASLNGAGSLDDAKEALLKVAMRNADIQSVNDLPASKEDVMSFIKDERARELFQEGHRLYDLRRWDESASVYAYSAPEIKFTFNNYKISDLVFPIPSDEITAGFGVTQNDWSNTLPK